jgi:hypothetical protein
MSTRRQPWIAGETPWIRRDLSQNRYTRCPFCGEESAILSVSVRSADYGRVEIYCDSPECDAREIIILVRRGEGAHQRADVRALRAVDHAVPIPDVVPLLEDFGEEWPEYRDEDSADREIKRRRWEAANKSDPDTRRRLAQIPFRINVD